MKNSLALKARVLRTGEWQELDARTLVPGDIVRLYLGDVVPADCKLIQGDYISIDQCVSKIGATLGVFVLPILKGKFGVPAILGMMAGVSLLGLTVTLIFGRQNTED